MPFVCVYALRYLWIILYIKAMPFFKNIIQMIGGMIFLKNGIAQDRKLKGLPTRTPPKHWGELRYS